MNFLQRVLDEGEKGRLPSPVVHQLKEFYQGYSEAVGDEIGLHEPVLDAFLDKVIECIQTPYPFEHFHKMVTEPFNYSQLGYQFFGPLVKKEESRLQGTENIDKIVAQIASGDNVILFANHQTEPDPQLIGVMLQEKYPQLAQEMIFVAGHRVTTDPLAVPFSIGLNLLCIYSKKHLDHPPEDKAEKLRHNQATMKRMSQLLAEGGKCIYVAPSGGRDRPNSQGEVGVAPFDPQSIEMFRLMAKRSGRSTHFYPLALSTYALFPPPNHVDKAIGERRHSQRVPIGIAFGSEISMEQEFNTTDRKERRQHLATHIWQKVHDLYGKMSR